MFESANTGIYAPVLFRSARSAPKHLVGSLYAIQLPAATGYRVVVEGGPGLERKLEMHISREVDTHLRSRLTEGC